MGHQVKRPVKPGVEFQAKRPLSVPQKKILSFQALGRSPQAHPVPNTHSQSVPKQVALAPPTPSAEDAAESDEDTESISDRTFLPEVPHFKKGHTSS